MNLTTVSGKELHPIGVGTWGFGGTWETDTSNDQSSVDSIRYSISQGQNHIDSGQIYGNGHTDEVIGKALVGQKREDLFITDKLWETSVAKGKVRPAVETMLKKLGIDYLDILYIHKPWEDFPWREAIPQIDELIDEGLVRYFGASNFSVSHLEDANRLSKNPVVTNQLHHNILHRGEVTPEMLAYCQKHHIQIIAYKPLERGQVLALPAVRQIARDHKATASQIALAWILEQGMFTIPRADTNEQIDQNLEAVKVELTPQEMKTLSSL